MIKTFAVFSLVLLSSAAFAESNTEVSYERLPDTSPSAMSTTVEITAGPGFASINANDAAEGSGGSLKSTTGFNFAVGFNIPMTTAVSFGTGLGFVQKGFGMGGILQDNGTTYTYSASFKMNYLVVPALLKLNFGDLTRVSIGVGPYAGVRVGSSAGATLNGVDYPAQIKTDNVSSTDFGLRGIASLEIPVDHSLSFLVGAGYDFGLSNLSTQAGEEVKSRTFLTNVGVGIKI